MNTVIAHFSIADPADEISKAVARFRRAYNPVLLLPAAAVPRLSQERDGDSSYPLRVELRVEDGKTFRGVPVNEVPGDGFWWVLIGGGAILDYGPKQDEEMLSYLAEGSRMSTRFVA